MAAKEAAEREREEDPLAGALRAGWGRRCLIRRLPPQGVAGRLEQGIWLGYHGSPTVRSGRHDSSAVPTPPPGNGREVAAPLRGDPPGGIVCCGSPRCHIPPPYGGRGIAEFFTRYGHPVLSGWLSP